MNLRQDLKEILQNFNDKTKMNGNIRNFNELSIYAFKGGFKRPNARFDNGRARLMHVTEALKGIMTNLVSFDEIVSNPFVSNCDCIELSCPYVISKSDIERRRVARDCF